MNHVFYHAGCLDGELCKYLYENLNFKSIYYPINAGDFYNIPEVDIHVNIFIFDLTVSEQMQKNLIERKFNVCIIDHHAGTFKNIEKDIIKVIHDESKSASRLLYESKLFDIKKSLELDNLIKCIEDRDLFRKNKSSDQIISALLFTKATNDLNYAEMFDVYLQNEAKLKDIGVILYKNREQNIIQTVKFACHGFLDVNGVEKSIGLVSGDRSLRSDVCDKLLDKYDIAVMYELCLWKKEIWLSWRSNKVDVNDICTKFSYFDKDTRKNGGGHKSAAGCTITNNTEYKGQKINLSNWMDIFSKLST